MRLISSILAVLCCVVLSRCTETHEFYFNASYVMRNPDGVHERRVVALNNQWPLPIIKVKEDDRIIIHLTNQLEAGVNTSLHFHGLFQRETNFMDGPEMVTQCPIPYGHTFVYNFTVTGQSGTYWYHSHSGSQYSDGLRAMLIVEPKNAGYEYDVEVPLSVSDWYHEESATIMKTFKNRYNPTGAEPIPQNSLFNDTKNVTWTVQPDTTYLLRIVNMGMFVSQYLYIEDHKFTVVEIDGIEVEPYETESILISVAQRYSVLVTTKKKVNPGTSFRFVNIIEKSMLDFHPKDLQIISTNWIKYDGGDAKPLPPLSNSGKAYEQITDSLKPVDDMKLVPVSREPLLENSDYQIVVNFTMETLGDGVQYAMFNGITYTAPKVPTLYSVLSADEKFVNEPAIYGSNTNSFILQENEVVEIVLNNQDPGAHPFHLHGHVFQVISRSEEGEDDENPIMYDPENPSHNKFPEIPMQRDTIVVNANGFVVLRFKADNPGVWFFHCHVDWHLEQGLALVLVEAPESIRQQVALSDIPESHFDACFNAKIPSKGNAAGNDKQWLDLKGENVQYKDLPEGFTTKGYVALILSAILGLYGIFSIYRFGMEDVKSDNSEAVIRKLYHILEEKKYNEIEYDSALDSLNSHGENRTFASENERR